MKKELEKLTKEQLLELVEHFEHYPSVTEEDDRSYILAYLEDEACQISEEQILKYLLKTIIVEISEDNIHLYYKFMNKDDISKYRDILHTFFNKRHPLNIEDFLEIDKEVIRENWKYDCFADGKIKTQSYFGIKDILKPIDEYIEEIKNSDAFKEFKRDILIQEAIDITNVVIIDFSEDEVAEYIERCIKYLNKRFGSKYVLEIWETDEIYGQRDDEDDCSEEYKGHLMYRGKIAIYDGVFEKDIKFTGIYCEISAVFSDLLSSLETIEKETISKAS